MGKSEAELRTKHFSAFSNFSKLVLSQSHSKTDIQLKKINLQGLLTFLKPLEKQLQHNSSQILH